MATNDRSCRTRRPTPSRCATLWACGAALAAPAGAAPLPPGASAPQQLQIVTVQGVAYGAQAVRLPSTVEVLGRARLTQGRQQVNLSETLNQVPGVVVNNRQDYAQDMQLSIRGFGADSPFGVQDVQMSLDGVPLTMPDGQGQSQLIDLPMIGAMKVIKGPFAALYGNAAGGVIQAYTEDAPDPPAASLSSWMGPWGSRQTTLIGGGRSGRVEAIAGLSDFRTDGWRIHSGASRKQFNTVLKWTDGDGNRYSVVFNALDQRGLDPSGQTLAEYRADPRGVAPSSLAYGSRKTARARQSGLRWEHSFDAADALQLSAYAGTRSITQYLAFSGSFANSAGGVVALDDAFGGITATYSHKGLLAARPYTLAAGLDYGRENEFRKGYVNDFGAEGALRNDQYNVVDNTAEFVQADWQFTPTLSFSGGLRHDSVAFEATPGADAPAASGTGGAARYAANDPVLGVLWKLDRANRLYGDWGRGFVTPTFYQLAYRPNNQPGLNFALLPMHLNNTELGWRGKFRGVRAQAALYSISADNQIVVDTNTGGRTTYMNAGSTRRYGAELSLDVQLPAHLQASIGLTEMHIRFVGGPYAGATLPGAPQQQAYAALTWRPPLAAPALRGFYTRLSLLSRSRIYVDSQNLATPATGWVALNWAAGVEQRDGPWKLSEFVRVDNLGDRTYVGAVVINSSTSQFYESAPGRALSAGLSLTREF
ncbi:Fe(3+) dicitrate transport protein FecA precursor [mine drainage metagenome]|uniref:Fe(3+) dicitrate transport protein FecA n=1 Tax=mine drainage metagenome TaxID=410659 RepID=A0A1J5R0V2_9ZZZZ